MSYNLYETPGTILRHGVHKHFTLMCGDVKDAWWALHGCITFCFNPTSLCESTTYLAAILTQMCGRKLKHLKRELVIFYLLRVTCSKPWYAKKFRKRKILLLYSAKLEGNVITKIQTRSTVHWLSEDLLHGCLKVRLRCAWFNIKTYNTARIFA